MLSKLIGDIFVVRGSALAGGMVCRDGGGKFACLLNVGDTRPSRRKTALVMPVEHPQYP